MGPSRLEAPVPAGDRVQPSPLCVRGVNRTREKVGELVLVWAEWGRRGGGGTPSPERRGQRGPELVTPGLLLCPTKSFTRLWELAVKTGSQSHCSFSGKPTIESSSLSSLDPPPTGSKSRKLCLSKQTGTPDLACANTDRQPGGPAGPGLTRAHTRRVRAPGPLLEAGFCRRDTRVTHLREEAARRGPAGCFPRCAVQQDLLPRGSRPDPGIH